MKHPICSLNVDRKRLIHFKRPGRGLVFHNFGVFILQAPFLKPLEICYMFSKKKKIINKKKNLESIKIYTFLKFIKKSAIQPWLCNKSKDT
jgi:hypothetical protein